MIEGGSGRPALGDCDGVAFVVEDFFPVEDSGESVDRAVEEGDGSETRDVLLVTSFFLSDFKVLTNKIAPRAPAPISKARPPPPMTGKIQLGLRRSELLGRMGNGAISLGAASR